MNNAEQQFLNELDNKLWKAADKLRANMNAGNYKHVVQGLIFLNYVPAASEARLQRGHYSVPLCWQPGQHL